MPQHIFGPMSKPITIYSTVSCPFCKMAKAYFKEIKVPFTDVDVTNDADKADEMVRKSGQLAVPVIDIGGTIIVGFDRARIDAALAEGSRK